MLESFELDLPYGSATRRLVLPAWCQVDVIAPRPLPPRGDPHQAVADALDAPEDGYNLEQFRGARSAAIAINDKTRPVLHGVLLPPLLDRLASIGIVENAVEVLVATGTHTPASEEEIRRTYPPEIVARCRIHSHDCDDPALLIDLGATSRGTPVMVNRRFYEADLRVVTGNIEPHHFMGFSGGVKSAAIGLAGRQTINTNHAMLVNPLTRAGLYDQNPMRMDVEEIGAMMGVHFALNTIQNDDLEVIHALAGHPLAVMRRGIRLSREATQVEVSGSYDLVIASAGGYPKDINLYQAQKALTHGAMIAREGGWVLVAAECREGSGSLSCEQFLEDVSTIDQVFDKFQRQGFRVGPHKAFQIAREARRVRLALVSSLPQEMARKFFFTPYSELSQAIASLLTSLPDGARIAVMPSATHTIPYSPGGAA